MKFIKNLLFFTAILFNSLAASASTYLGEFCWTVQHTDGIARYFRLGISHVGDSHYTVAGKWTKGDLSASSPTHGNAEVIDGNLEISLVRTDNKAGNMRLRGFHLELDASYNGTFRSLALNEPGGFVGGVEAPVVISDCTTLP